MSNPSVTCPEFPPSHPGFSCFPCPTVHPVTCPPGFCPPTHPNVSCLPCVQMPARHPETLGCTLVTCDVTIVRCPSIGACPPPTHVQCTSLNPACGGATVQQTPQQQAGGGPQYYRGGRSGTYSPYGP